MFGWDKSVTVAITTTAAVMLALLAALAVTGWHMRPETMDAPSRTADDDPRGRAVAIEQCREQLRTGVPVDVLCRDLMAH